jgi:hypothetical protein
MIDSYGVLNQNQSLTEIDLAKESLRLLGYATLCSQISEREMDEIRVYSKKLAADYVKEYSSSYLNDIGESNNFRAPLLKNKAFLKIGMNGPLLALVSQMIVGKYFLNQQNLVINPPSSTNYNQVKFHRDLPYQHYVSTRPLAINALLAVDDFTLENGTTVIVPASHKMEECPSNKLIEKVGTRLEVKAGTFLILDCMTFHAAGVNRSSAERIGINHVFTSMMFRPQIDFNNAMGDREKSDLSAEERQILGIEYPIPGGVATFLSGRKRS